MKNEPAIVRGVVAGVLALLVATGLVNADAISPEAADTITAALLLVAPILSAVFIRRKVTPVERAAEAERVALFTGEPVEGDDLNAGPVLRGEDDPYAGS